MGKKTKSAPVNELASWDEVDKALREIAECEIGIETLEADMNRKINDAKVEAEKLGKPLQTAIEVLEKQIQAFVEDNSSDLTGKSKYLNFGSVGFRKVTRISYSTKKTDEILESLKKHGMINCILVKESINKEALKLYSDKEITKVGAKRVVEERFYCEADREKLKG